MSEKRRHLFEFHIERIEHAYRSALDSGVRSPVVLVMDCSDPFGRRVASAIAGDEKVDQHIEAAGDGFDPCVIVGVENDTKSLTPLLRLSEDGSASLSKPTEEGVFYVVIVADDGSSIASQSLP